MERWYRICQKIGKVIIFYWFVKVEGKLPERRALILTSNHRSLLDAPLLAIIFRRRIWFLAKERIFNWFFIGWLIVKSNWALSVSKKSSLKRVADLLKGGGAIVIFPEGTRNKTRQPLKKFERGFARLAIKNQVPIVPVAIVYKKFWWLPSGVKVKIGKPISITNMTEDNLTEITRGKILSLLSQG